MTPQQKYQLSEKGIATRKRFQRAARARDPDRFRARDRQWSGQNKHRLFVKNIKQRYRMSLVQWLALFHAQDQRCAMCRADSPGKRGWATDHDHETGRVRGILCHSCNLRLGWLGDTSAEVAIRLVRVQSYLAEPRKNPDKSSPG